MLYYFYHGYYDTGVVQQTSAVSHLHSQVYFIADKYFVAPLALLALTRFKAAALGSWHSDAFANTVQVIYDNTLDHDHSLRVVLRETVTAHATALFTAEGPVSRLRQLLDECPQFAAEMVLALTASLREHAAEHRGERCEDDHAVRTVGPVPGLGDLADIDAEPPERSYQCPRCQEVFQATIWDREFYRHRCSPVTAAQHVQVILSEQSGYAWRTRYAV